MQLVIYLDRPIILCHIAYIGIYLRRKNTVTQSKGFTSPAEDMCAERTCLMHYVERGLKDASWKKVILQGIISKIHISE